MSTLSPNSANGVIPHILPPPRQTSRGRGDSRALKRLSRRYGEIPPPLPGMIQPPTPRSGPLKLRERIKACMDLPAVELTFGVIIVFNAVFLGLETDYVASHPGTETPPEFLIAGFGFTILFSIELILRLYGERIDFFTSDHAAWNMLDLIIVLMSLVEMALDIAPKAASEGLEDAWGSTTQFRILRVARMTRLIRVIRVARIIRFFRALRTLAHQLLHTVKSLVWGLLLLTLVVFSFGVLFTQGVTSHRQQPGHVEPESEFGETSPLEIYWSTVPRSMSTLFMSITGGVSWVGVVQPLSDVGSGLVALFVGYVGFAQFAVLNVLTGVFCQNAIDSAQHDQDLVMQSIIQHKQMYVERLCKIFQELDTDESGTVTIEELEHHLGDEAIQAYFQALELDVSDVRTFFQLLDLNGGDDIDAEEFVASCLRLRGGARGVDLATLMRDLSRMAKRMDDFIEYSISCFCHLTGQRHHASEMAADFYHDAGGP